MSGSETPQGPGWWQASDGLWYPPQEEEAALPTPPPAFTPSGGDALPPTFTPTEASGAEGGPFFSRLFDTSFRTFITPSIVKVLFWIGVVLVSLVCIAFLIAFIAEGGAAIVVGIVVVPLMWFIYVIYTRVFLELMIVLFRIEQNTRSDETS